MFITAESLKQTILAEDPFFFVSKYLLECVPHIFADDLNSWLRWKSRLAAYLEVDPHEMVLTGSAAIGFSLNPHKNFKQFNDRSDIDVAVISVHHFDLGWRWLRRRRTSELTLERWQLHALNEHRTNYIYWGTIATDRILGLLPFGGTWTRALEDISRVEPTLERSVNVRVYRDFEALRGYQANGLRILKDQLLTDQPESAEVPIS